MRFVFSTAQRPYSSRTWFNVGRNFNRAPVYDYPGISSSFHLQASITLSREHIKTEITGNFLHHLTDGLKKEASVFGILTQFALAQRAVVFLGFWGKIFLDIMKVISAVLLVAVFWSQEWKSTLSDSIIHIGKLLRFSSSKSQPERDSVSLSGNRRDVSALLCAVLLKSQRRWRYLWRTGIKWSSLLMKLSAFRM